MTRTFAFYAFLTVGFLFYQPNCAEADLVITFTEDAPKDFIEVRNQSDCTLAPFDLIIDLEGSRGALIFDTQKGGAGENVAQPLEIAAGRALINSLPTLDDGQRVSRISFVSLKPQQSVLFTLDVDDTRPQGPMGVQMIAGTEIAGAQVFLQSTALKKQTGVFNEQAVATLNPCSRI